MTLFLKTLSSLSSLLRKSHRVPITRLIDVLWMTCQMLFLSNWFRSSCTTRNQCSLTIATPIPVGSIYETKATSLHTLLRDYRVVSPLVISQMTFWIGWSFVRLHSFGRSGCSCGVPRIWSWDGSSIVTWFSFSSWFGHSFSLYSSRFVFYKIHAQSITYTSIVMGLDLSKVAWIDSSVVRLLLL